MGLLLAHASNTSSMVSILDSRVSSDEVKVELG